MKFLSRFQILLSAVLMMVMSQAVAGPEDEVFLPVTGLNNFYGRPKVRNVCFANASIKAFTQIPGFLHFLKGAVQSSRVQLRKVYLASHQDPLLEAKLNVQESLHDLLSSLRSRSLETSLNRRGDYHEAESRLFFRSMNQYLMVRNDDPQRPYFDIVGNRPRYIGIDQIDAEEFMRVTLDVVGFSDSPSGIKTRSYFEIGNETQDKRFSRVESESPLILSITDSSIQSVADALSFHQKAEQVTERSEFILGNQDADDTHTAEQMKRLPRFAYQRSLKFVYDGVQLPSHLIVGLKRTQVVFGRGGRVSTEKLTKRVQIDPFNPLQVDFYDERDPGLASKVTQALVPSAVVMQGGRSSEGGHYVALIKDQKRGDWYLHDDRDVRKVEIHSYLEGPHGMNQNAYVIVYSAVQGRITEETPAQYPIGLPLFERLLQGSLSNK